MKLAFISVVEETLQIMQDERGELKHLEQREEKRVRLHVPGEVTGIDSDGRLFVEQIMIEDLSNSGCRFLACVLLKKGDTVAVKPLVPGKKCVPDEPPQLFEIAWTDNGKPVASFGARRLQGENLATIKFPPANYSPRRPQK